jgi:hypothetical protein
VTLILNSILSFHKGVLFLSLRAKDYLYWTIKKIKIDHPFYQSSIILLKGIFIFLDVFNWFNSVLGQGSLLKLKRIELQNNR